MASTEPRTQAARSAATQRILLDTARRLFTERGYAATPTEEIVRQAGVTRGALYHHFRDKQDLFRAVFVEIEDEYDEIVRAAAMAKEDPWDAFVAGCSAAFDAALRPDMQRILLVEAPVVLGWDTWREIDSGYALRSVRGGLRALIERGYIDDMPTGPVANLVVGALNYGMLAMARSEDPAAARKQFEEALDRLLRGLRKA